MFRRIRLALLAVAICAAGVAPHGAAQPRTPTADLSTSLAALVTTANLGDHVGIAVADAATGRVIFESHGATALNPASNMKLITAAAVLSELGSDFQMLTGLYGKIEGDAVTGGLYIKGFGDPTLRISDLHDLAQDLADQGVRTVDEVVVDGGYFDAQFLPPAFDQQPNEVATFRAAIGAVSVDENAYALRIIPGAEAGQPAVVRLDARGYFDVTSELTTSPGGDPNVRAEQRTVGDRLALTLRGTVPLGIRGVTYRRRVERPLAYAGYALVEALRRAGIRAPGRIRVGVVPPESALLASHRSAPLAQILPALGKDSDNFTAEMLLKVLGAERRHRPGRTADGVSVALGVLGRMGIAAREVTMINGSGLYEGNLVAPLHVVKLLGNVYRNPGLRAEYVSQLAIGGVDGTLGGRFRDLRAPRVVRGKTGTLNDVIALSGYVLGPSPERALTFSILANGVTGHHGEARTLGDGIVRALVDDLYPPPPTATPPAP